MPDRVPSRRTALLSALSPGDTAGTADVAAFLNLIRANRRPLAGDEPPLPPRPGIFQPDVPITGPPEFVRLATRLLNQSPEVKALLKSITMGPTESVIRDLNESGLTAEQYPRTNLMGETSFRSPYEVSVNPRLTSDPRLTGEDLSSTLVHELTHVAQAEGERGEDNPHLAEAIWRARRAKGR